MDSDGFQDDGEEGGRNGQRFSERLRHFTEYNVSE